MNTLGLISGLTPEGSAVYQRHLHREVHRRWEGHSARIVSCSLDQAQVVRCVETGAWTQLAETVVSHAKCLVSIGAQAIAFDSSILHAIAEPVSQKISVPFISLLDETARELKSQQLRCVALVGTRCRPEESAWLEAFSEEGVQAVLPSTEDRELIHSLLDAEFSQGYAEEPSRVDVLRIVKALKRQGARAVLLAAPEMSILIDPCSQGIPMLDASKIHAHAVARWMLSSSESFPLENSMTDKHKNH
jgi:aspartate racemase